MATIIGGLILFLNVEYRDFGKTKNMKERTDFL